MKQQQDQIDLLTKQYNHEAKILEQKQVIQDYKAEKRQKRDEKIERLKEKRMYEMIVRKQRQSEQVRDTHHESVQRQFLKVAKEVEKKRRLEAAMAHREGAMELQGQSQKFMNTIESIFNTKVRMLKEQVEQEKYERMVVEKA